MEMTDEKSVLNSGEISDILRVANNVEVKEMIKSRSKGIEETILYSNLEVKINRKKKSQNRVMIITDRALYNLKPNDYTTCKRRILIENIGAISTAGSSAEFVIHIPDEYDYRYKSSNRDIIISILQKQFYALTRRKLAVLNISAPLDTVTVTRDQAVFQTREAVLERKKKFASQEPLGIEANELKIASRIEINETDEAKPSVMVDTVDLESFELLKVLGRGAFGKVMMVRKKDTGVVFAMKVLKKNMVFARKQVDHTLAERKVLEAFQHPFLVGLRYAFQTPAKLYLVMDFYDGGELFFHLRKVKRFTEDQARLFVAEIALGLGHLHTLDFVYRDLKPENILLDVNGHICLTDFGLAKELNPSSETETYSFVGTPEYLAPEMVQGTGHNKAVDWWCLGILLYELTVGITPFYSGNVDEMYHKIVHAKLRFPPRLSEECRDLISKLLIRDPKDRLGSGDGDVEELKSHKFFEKIDWDVLMRKEIESTFKPNSAALDNFSPQFIEEEVVDSVVPDAQIKQLPAEANFTRWTFDSSKNVSDKSAKV
jgi:serum/glucocorticoid-regulated kinase 2